MRPLPAAAARQFGAFTTGQALRAGWTSHALRHAVAVGALVRLRPGVYARPVEPGTDPFGTRRLSVAAAGTSLAHRRLTIAAAAAAVLSGIEVLDAPQDVCAVYARGRRGPMVGVHRHRGRLRNGHVMAVGPILMTTPARTVVDLGRESGARAAVVGADSALRGGRTSHRDLLAMLGDCAGWPGVRQARRAIQLADPRAESALESVSRLLMADAGLPRPEPQVIIRTSGGRFIGRVDFYWDELGVVAEADGLSKYDVYGENDPLRAQNIRQGLLEDTNLIVVRWGWRDTVDFAPTAARLERAFARATRPDRGPRQWVAESTVWPQRRAAG